MQEEEGGGREVRFWESYQAAARVQHRTPQDAMLPPRCVCVYVCRGIMGGWLIAEKGKGRRHRHFGETETAFGNVLEVWWVWPPRSTMSFSSLDVREKG